MFLSESHFRRSHDADPLPISGRLRRSAASVMRINIVGDGLTEFSTSDRPHDANSTAAICNAAPAAALH
jgi:hypothetical protein